MANSEYKKRTEAAAFLGISVRTIDRLIDLSQPGGPPLDHYRIGRLVRFDEAQLRRYAAENEVARKRRDNENK